MHTALHKGMRRAPRPAQAAHSAGSALPGSGSVSAPTPAPAHAKHRIAHLPRQLGALVLVLWVAACGGGGESGDLACSVVAGSAWLSGKVSHVHDGDTLSLQTGSGTEQIRLDGIDAPEWAQSFGNTAQQALSQLALGQTVRVAYRERDRYGRVLGQVFNAQCLDLNAQLLSTGMAWFYSAYACDLDVARRSRYTSAQSLAQLRRLGLWSQPQPMAPWVYRNGSDPAAPVCLDG